ncbi:hypothetical protein NPIL_11231 [Nephila pilipes]|uniref:Uncharacterized protein n=1 Tax=Nephila pilipes TaxID=299642 RepID=A0A8X6Q9S2_NEPPI|nr:hypothetical protein NPIL_375051 [Nephila pilipes]GFU14555.1 hypothetical protein NPIL_11231 [Nephila pilipes]
MEPPALSNGITQILASEEEYDILAKNVSIFNDFSNEEDIRACLGDISKFLISIIKNLDRTIYMSKACPQRRK